MEAFNLKEIFQDEIIFFPFKYISTTQGQVDMSKIGPEINSTTSNNHLEMGIARGNK